MIPNTQISVAAHLKSVIESLVEFSDWGTFDAE
jgi:1-deoxy-D-xylulose 5-phosphate reductoisomerase